MDNRKMSSQKYHLDINFDRNLGKDETFDPVNLPKKVYTNTQQFFLI